MKGSSQSQPCADKAPQPCSPVASVEITAHIDGKALRFNDVVLEVYPPDVSNDRLRLDRRAALTALTMLSNCLARA